MKKAILVLFPIVFLAQSCNIFSLGSPDTGSGSRGIFFSTDGGGTWTAGATEGEGANLSGATINSIFIESKAHKIYSQQQLERGYSPQIPMRRSGYFFYRIFQHTRPLLTEQMIRKFLLPERRIVWLRFSKVKIGV